MKISDITKKYLVLKKAVLQLTENADFTEMDMFINSLRKFRDYEIADFKKVIDSIDLKLLENTSKKGKAVIKSDSSTVIKMNNKDIMNNTDVPQVKDESVILDEVLNSLGVSDVDFSTIEMSTIDHIESKDLLTKKQLLILASKIGITKSVFKSKNDLYEEIKRNILNRDVINNIESYLKSPNNN